MHSAQRTRDSGSSGWYKKPAVCLCWLTVYMFCGISSAQGLEEEHTDSQLTLTVNANLVRHYLNDPRYARWWIDADYMRVRMQLGRLLEDVDKQYGKLPPVAQAIENSPLVALNWNLELPMMIGPQTRTDRWELYFSLAEESDFPRGPWYWMGEAYGLLQQPEHFQITQVADQGVRAPYKLPAAKPDTLLDLRLPLDAGKHNLPNFSETLASFIPFAVFPVKQDGQNTLKAIESTVLFQQNKLNGRVVLDGMTSKRNGAYEPRFRRSGSDASIVLPVSWASSALSAFVTFRYMLGLDGEGVAGGLSSEESLSRLAKSPWSELFSEWLYGEFWWENERAIFPEGVLVLPLREKVQLPLNDQNLHAFFGDLVKKVIEGVTVWEPLDYPFLIMVENDRLMLLSSMSAYEKYQVTEALDKPEADSPLIVDLRIPSLALRKMLVSNLWDDDFSIPLGQRLPVFLLDVLRSIPNQAFQAGASWPRYLSQTTRKSLADFEASSRSAESVLTESVALYNAGPRAVLSRPALIIRTDQGWYIQHGWESLQGPLEREALDEFVAQMKLVGGAPATELKPFEIHPLRALDAALFPSIERLLTPNKDEYRLKITDQKGGIRLDERSIPLASLGAMVLAGMYQYRQSEHITLLRGQAEANAIMNYFQDHEEQHEALSALSMAIQEYQAEHHQNPPTLSTLVEGAYLDFDALNALQGDRKLTGDELDQLGHWHPEQDAQLIWEYALSDQWMVWMNGVAQFGLRPRVPLKATDYLDEW